MFSLIDNVRGFQMGLARERFAAQGDGTSCGNHPIRNRAQLGLYPGADRAVKGAVFLRRLCIGPLFKEGLCV